MPEIQNQEIIQLKSRNIKILNRFGIIIGICGLLAPIVLLITFVDKYCFGYDNFDLNGIISFLLIVLSFIFFFVGGLLGSKYKIKNSCYRNAAIFLVLFFIGLGFAGLTGRSAREKAYDATVKSDFAQINAAQDLYFNDNSSYAASCNALVPKYIYKCPVNPVNQQPYRMALSNDKQSWSIETTLTKTNNEICSKSKAANLLYHCDSVNGFKCEETSN